MPTRSPPLMVSRSSGSSVSSTMFGGPYAAGVAAPSTNSQRGVITPTPKERWLGFTRWTLMAVESAEREIARAGKNWTETAPDIVTLLRGSSSAAGNSEAEATSRVAWHQSGGNVVYRTFYRAAPRLRD